MGGVDSVDVEEGYITERANFNVMLVSNLF